ncbi:MAG TPA: DUF559 domain-containing protein [Solirubrobacteraceae bacterium]|nr:DUF559 domain-containing protein [Solirubrobacteraceae bacterium]
MPIHAWYVALRCQTSRGGRRPAAVRAHPLALALTRGDLELLLLTLCQADGLPIPEVNVYVHGKLVDAHWPHARIIVEVDGWQGHRTRGQLENDHQRDLELRALGYIVLRYTWRQVTETPALVAADLRRSL